MPFGISELITKEEYTGILLHEIGHKVFLKLNCKIENKGTSSQLTITFLGVVLGVVSYAAYLSYQIIISALAVLLILPLYALYDIISAKTYSIGLKNELKEGAATVICTLDDNVRREYSIEILNINRSATGNKCFTVKITDEKLLSSTGGIVQGMSGSPIIQNGKLVGAITHVLINDPTMGYGIFIENMLTQSASIEQYIGIAA